MTEEQLNTWIAALRSGEYKQGSGMLRSTNDEYCCLGVCIDALGLAKWERADDTPRCYRAKFSDGMMSRSSITGSTQTRMGLDYHVPVYIDEHHRPWIDYLIKMNDEYGSTFDQIADVLDTEFRKFCHE